VGIWDFSGPIEVIGVDPGGPADLVGIQLGDQITAVNGERLESREGGEIFSRMTPGDSLELTLVKRSGEERLVSVVPVTSDSLSTAVRLRTRGGLGISRSVGPVAGVVVPHADLPVPTAAEPPEGLPLRYSGTVEGVEVEVRGAPVTVSEMQDARILLINADGIWIRVRVPARRREAPESR
jgi:membrane-associated protease RseP (regulator of RpoE activity)